MKLGRGWRKLGYEHCKEGRIKFTDTKFWGWGILENEAVFRDRVV